MWIFTELGFFSIVKSYDNDNEFLIRSRTKEDLERLINRYGLQTQILHNAGTDYAYRIILSKFGCGSLMMHITCDIDYENFKTRCHFTLGKERAHALSIIWRIMLNFQEKIINNFK